MSEEPAEYRVRENQGRLVGVRGWLLFYAIVPTAIFGLLVPVWMMITGTFGDSNGIWSSLEIEVLRFSANVIGLYLIICVRKPLTRTFHIWFNSIVTLEFFIYVGYERIPFFLFAAFGILIWVGYWIVSKRVKATYCPDTHLDSDRNNGSGTMRQMGTPASTGKTLTSIRHFSEGLWRLTLTLTIALPLLVLLAGWLLDEARILSADEEVLIPLAIFGFVAPYIFVKTWLWVRQGFVQDHE